MAEMNFGGVMETVVTSKEFSLEKAREVIILLFCYLHITVSFFVSGSRRNCLK